MFLSHSLAVVVERLVQATLAAQHSTTQHSTTQHRFVVRSFVRSVGRTVRCGSVVPFAVPYGPQKASRREEGTRSALCIAGRSEEIALHTVALSCL